MNVIAEIKDRLDIVELAGEHLQLQRAGKNWKARCPFHDDHMPSLVVFPDSQRWACFGAGCNQGGDLIDLVQRVQNWDFPSTLRTLAERAGVEMKPLSEEERAQEQVRQGRERVFGTAMAFFQEHLFRPASHFNIRAAGQLTAELAYALGRGWSKETLLEAGVGSLGNEREGLRRCLLQAGIDLELPAAVALLGWRGKVREWAEKYQVQAPQAWLEQDRIPPMPPNMLIYPHLERGRAVYLAGRHLYEKGHWNPPRELAGPRQPFYNTLWWRSDLPEALIVEGQGDALTLAQWGIPAVALAGCSLTGNLAAGTNQAQAGQSELLRAILQKATSARVAVALDADEAGEKGSRQAAGALCQAGLQAKRIGLVRWPDADANQWLQNGAQAEQAWELVHGSGSWMDELIRQAAGLSQDETALQRAFQALAELNAYELVAYKDRVCQKLKLPRGTFESLLKTARAERTQRMGAGERGGAGEKENPTFRVVDGCIWRHGYNAQGQETLDKLSNFCARIEKEVRRDDGQQVELEFRIGGEVKGDRLPMARVLAEEFERMEWVVREWGVGAIIEPGRGRRDQLRAAIQYLSHAHQQERVFTHTGWRELDSGERAYLSGTGALGRTGIEVDLDSDLRKYRLPETARDPVGAMKESLQFINLAPFEITTPLWAAIWLAPLSELVRTTFVLWLYGRTGTLKSTLAALALNHYGAEFDGFQFPANFTDTPGRLEHKAFLAKDALLVIDDYAPQKNPRDAQEYQRAANHIIRAVGNQAGRGRLTKEIQARRSYTPRGVVAATGEELPEAESLLARLFVVEFKVDSVDQERLGEMQKKREVYPHAMVGYLGWVGEHWNTYKDLLPQQWERHRRRAAGEGAHLRLPESAASLMVGWEMGLRYALSIEALGSDDYRQLLELGWSALMGMCKEMKQRTDEEKPEELFLNTLRELLTQGKIYLRQRGGPKVLGGPEERAEMLGWYDEAQVYLLPEAAYARVARHFREQGGLFPARQPTLRKGLKEAGWLVENKGRSTFTEWLDGRVQRVLVLRREVMDDLPLAPP